MTFPVAETSSWKRTLVKVLLFIGHIPLAAIHHCSTRRIFSKGKWNSSNSCLLSFSEFNVALLFLSFRSSDLSLPFSVPFWILDVNFLMSASFYPEVYWRWLIKIGSFFWVRNSYRMKSTTFKRNHYRWGRKLCNGKGNDRNTCQKVMSTPIRRDLSPHVPTSNPWLTHVRIRCQRDQEKWNTFRRKQSCIDRLNCGPKKAKSWLLLILSDECVIGFNKLILNKFVFNGGIWKCEKIIKILLLTLNVSCCEIR